MKDLPKYRPISTDELRSMLSIAQDEYLLYCHQNAQFMVETRGQSSAEAQSHPLCEERLQHQRKSTGIFDEAMRRVARDYSDEKFQMLDDYYRYVHVEFVWGTRLWMNILYNLMGFPKTFWLMRHFPWLI